MQKHEFQFHSQWAINDPMPGLAGLAALARLAGIDGIARLAMLMVKED